jgi:hypothetical protein
MDWLGNNEPQAEQVDNPTTEKLASLTKNPIPRTATPPKMKKKILEDTMEWVRNNPNPDDVHDPLVQSLANLAGIPVPQANIPTGKKKPILEKGMDCMLNNELQAEQGDIPTIEKLATYSPVYKFIMNSLIYYNSDLYHRRDVSCNFYDS